MVTRGTAREQAILTATIELLHSGGYAALTMDAVAATARASKTTIYRRWRGKPDLVRAAVEAYRDEHSPPLIDTGTLRGDLLALLSRARDKTQGEFMALMGDLMQAMRHDPELRAALWARLVDEPGPFAVIVPRAVARGEAAAHATGELAHEVAEALILRQVALGEEWRGEEFLVHVVDDILLPLLTHPRPTGDPR
ncbi:AcrR family transcriptional regulator [Allocatelliglobosispora scoriae]|uniref:AcrR family transcriptional regulator n=1 Tax=Allocatelliglobosispora scoriae TaxID=643052 RepID=A0A841BXV9_9ACTN|nr:TetR/AcrR family transcriptional regulator [Allocatelliglobosispora scoriae]MBB5873987.1 AcrR family transcriptional regulator [Allocatelliglobosispora scoriae]